MNNPEEIITNTYQIKDRRFHEQVSAFTLQVCTPIYWHDRQALFPKEIRGASCFILRFGERLIGVTANHVIDEYKKAQARIPTLVCQLRMMPFDLADAIIDSNDELDIATFRLTESELKQAKGVPVDCTNQWPSPTPDHMRAISLAGFPEIIRQIYSNRTAEFRAYGALIPVESVNDREIITIYDPALARPLAGCPNMPPLGFNMSGCSGGPVLMHGERNGLHRWFPVGLIVGGRGNEASGETAGFDMIRIRRIHFVNPDGTITRLSSGWLPR
jgi:hypothetical protein